MGGGGGGGGRGGGGVAGNGDDGDTAVVSLCAHSTVELQSGVSTILTSCAHLRVARWEWVDGCSVEDESWVEKGRPEISLLAFCSQVHHWSGGQATKDVRISV